MMPFEVQAIGFYIILAVAIAIVAIVPLRLTSPPIEKDYSEAQAHMSESEILASTAEESQQHVASTVLSIFVRDLTFLGILCRGNCFGEDAI
jgi:uncharacterized protein YpmS